jgi:NarL family two-component system response regulator LiaR
MSETFPIRVMIADDHAMLRAGLILFIDNFDDLELVGEAANGVDAIQICTEVKPDVVLMDVMMPEMDGVEATRAIRDVCPETQVIIFTDFYYSELTQAALDAGAVICLLKNASIDQLADVIRTAHKATTSGDELETPNNER